MFLTKRKIECLNTPGKQEPLPNKFVIFYFFKLKLGNKLESKFQTIVCFLIVDFKDFWRENDVIRQTSKFEFDIFTKLMHDFKRIC